MPEELTEQITKLRKPRGSDLRGLISCATSRLGKAACTSISSLGEGGFNHVYKITFSDSSAIAASVSLQDREDFNPRAKLSEFATMEFVRTSGLYPEIVVPVIHAYDISFSNPAGVPYTLMQLFEGTTYAWGVWDENLLRGMDMLPQADQAVMVKALAKLQAALRRPVPFNKIGSIFMDESGKFSVGPLFNLGGEERDGPYDSIEEFWRGQVDQTMVKLLKDWSYLDSDELMPSFWDSDTPQKFSKAYQYISALIPHFIPPTPYLQLVLHHPDLAFRNVFFDPQDHSKIIGVIDWTGAQILPLMLTAQFPHDLRSDNSWPVERKVLLADLWNTISYDWTSLGDTSKYDASDIPRIKAMVRRYYLCQHFSVCYAEYVEKIHGDNDLARATLFADAMYYIKFNEFIASDARN